MIPISENLDINTSHRKTKHTACGAARQDTRRSAKCRARGDLGVQRCDWSWYG